MNEKGGKITEEQMRSESIDQRQSLIVIGNCLIVDGDIDHSAVDQVGGIFQTGQWSPDRPGENPVHQSTLFRAAEKEKPTDAHRPQRTR